MGYACALRMGRALHANGLVKVLGGSRVLRGVEASFPGGMLHAIEGANGSGKSTLLALLGGRTAPTSGFPSRADSTVSRSRTSTGIGAGNGRRACMTA